MAMASAIDCGDRSCEVEYRLLPNCVLYVDIDKDSSCQYPCSFVNCQTEVHQYTVCPIWTCTGKTTTPSPPPATLVPFPTNSSSSSLITSIVFNVLFGIIILAIVGFFLIRRRQNRRLTAYLSQQTNPLFVSGFDLFNNQRPIIRNAAERDPLIPRSPPRRNSNPRPQIPNFYGGPEAAVLAVSSNVQETSF